ncbi:unnamed protein product [Danaus chrysippus]|nr:unnamed protein product [Danaus chrysippus]
MEVDDVPEINFESSVKPLTSYSTKLSQESKIQQNEILQTIDTEDDKQDSEHEDVVTLAESVDTLRVAEANSVPVKTQTKELLQNFIQDLTEYDTTFLKQYLDVLQNNNQMAIKDVSNNVISSIEQVLRYQSEGHSEWPEHVLLVLLSWLTVTVLCLTDPHIKTPYRVFSELLTQTNMKMRVRLATVCWRYLSPEQLIELADVATGVGGRMDSQTRGEGEGEGRDTSLADLLLRAALCRLQETPTEPQWFLGRLEGEEVTQLVSSAWPAAEGGARSLLTRVVMRARAAGRLHAPPALLRAASRATSSSSQPETIKV